MKKTKLKNIGICCVLTICVMFCCNCNRRANYVYIDGEKVQPKKRKNRKTEICDSISIQKIINDDAYHRNKRLEYKNKDSIK